MPCDLIRVARGRSPGLACSARQRGWRVRVQGILGIRETDLSRIFDPYFTTRRGGTGLGLPIAKNIIEGLGGTIDVSTAPGRGTAIQIHLPASAPIA